MALVVATKKSMVVSIGRRWFPAMNFANKCQEQSKI
jgi:hypothetical protein